MYYFSLLSLAYLLFSAHFGEGSIRCVDLEQCDEYLHESSCEDPGIWRYCMKFCNACIVTDTGHHCNTGYVEIGGECEPCRELPLGQRWVIRECPQGCPQGKWGLSCSRDCSPGCYSPICERWGGECSGGCTVGRYGQHCGLHCENCGGRGRCSEDGRCMEGCSTGWQGQYCLQRD